MRALLLGGLFLAATAGHSTDAQVITGESTYEDNFIHQPPATEPSGQSRARTAAPTTGRAGEPSTESRTTAVTHD